MINISNIDDSEPYKIFKDLYNQSIDAGQKSIEAIAISSFNKSLEEVDSRFVNLKKIECQDWFFYSNYNSPKAMQFRSHSQIAGLFYWEKLNIQIRLKANIEILDSKESDRYFINRSDKKNALAISSDQSKNISSYNRVIENYNKTLEDTNLMRKRPLFWGGYVFKPYYFEFWRGHESRLNHRVAFSFSNQNWKKITLQP